MKAFNGRAMWTWVLVAATGVAAASAEPRVGFDSGSGSSLISGVRAAAFKLDVPAIGATKDAGITFAPAFWGSDGRWCDDGRVYHGGPCDNSGGGYPPGPAPGPYPPGPGPYPPGPAPYPPGPGPYPPPPGGGAGIRQALAVCRDLYSDSAKVNCVGEVRRAQYFDSDAVRVCRNIYSDTSKVDCLRAVANAPVGPQLAGFCGAIYSDSTKIACLGRARRAAYFNPDALRVCRQIYSDQTKLDCLDVIAGRPYGPAIVGLCGSIYSDSEKVRCLGQN